MTLCAPPEALTAEPCLDPGGCRWRGLRQRLSVVTLPRWFETPAPLLYVGATGSPGPSGPMGKPGRVAFQ